MPSYTYILQSKANQRFYYGSTQDLDQRLKAHNSGKVRSTKAHRPWAVYYVEEFETKSEAFKREQFFKSIEGYNWLRDTGIIKK